MIFSRLFIKDRPNLSFPFNCWQCPLALITKSYSWPNSISPVNLSNKSFLSIVAAFSFASCLNAWTSIHSLCPKNEGCITAWLQPQYLAKIHFWHWLFEGQKPSGILSSNMPTLMLFLASLNLPLIDMQVMQLPLNLISTTMSIAERGLSFRVIINICIFIFKYRQVF